MRMRWNKDLNFIVTLILSLAYVIVSLLNFVGPIDPPINALSHAHPILSFLYLIASLGISWGIYFYYRNKPGRFSFFLTILVGIALLFIGVFMWSLAGYAI